MTLRAFLTATLTAFCCACAAWTATAHQAALSVVSATELQPGRFALEWENKPTSALGDVFLDLGPVWPEHCAADGPLLDCGDRGLAGRVGFNGLGVAQSAAMIRVHWRSGGVDVVTLTPSRQTARLAPPVDASSWSGLASVGASYVALGIEHILIGVDHLLFVLGLIWISKGRVALVKTITAFTVAHSLTLAAVSLGWVGVPEGLVNTMIALSIAVVGLEILKREAGETSLTLRAPWLAAFGFGLLHGFGFANALVELGLPDGARLVALAAFNVGVELGQLAFVGVVLAFVWAWREMAAPQPRRSGPPVAYVIGGLACFWFVDRLVLLLGN